MTTTFSLDKPGDFVLGCNYWASHAGTNMWADWRPDVVAVDLERLAAHGIQVMRVFPLWPDFQPIVQLYGGQGAPREIRLVGEKPLPDTDAGRAGLSEEMLERFQVFADLCHVSGIHLIVGLLTGWMSGRLFVPPALEKLNVLTDPVCLMWEIRFVDGFVRRFKHHPAVYAWDLGNECNCMAPVPNHQAAYTWSATIANAIRAADPSRPIVSGMHSLTPGGPNPWLIQDQAETTDILTTHPYPYWTPHTRTDPLNTIRPLLHATSETRMYADIGGKTCLVEETGTMGPMLSSDEAAADFARTNLFSLWAHDCRSLIWWCANDQTDLEHAPYAWTAVERELGLLRNDGSPKPVLLEMKHFRDWHASLPFDTLPPRRLDAVCLLTHDQDHWGTAYSAFVLAKQAKLDIAYSYIDQPLPEAPCYLLPSLHYGEAVPSKRWRELLARAEAGATLYISLDDGILDKFNQVCGVELLVRGFRRGPYPITLDSGETLNVTSGEEIRLRAVRAEVLAQEADGNPVYIRASYGKGWIYVLTFPLEMQLTLTPGAFHAASAQPYFRIYQAFGETFRARRVLRVEHPMLGVTEHEVSMDEHIVVIVNYTPEEVTFHPVLQGGWKISKSLYGQAPVHEQANIPHHNALVWILNRD